MNNELTKTNSALSFSSEKPLPAIERFTAQLNEEPPKDQIYKGPDGKSDEIPISYIQSKLDEIYIRQWGYESCVFTVVINEICCDILVSVIDPQTGYKKIVAGTAALPIMMDALPERLKFVAGPPEPESKAKERNAWALDLQNKKPFAMKLQRAAVKSLALKNACKELGITFGRNLNRKHIDSPDSIYTDMLNEENDLYQAIQMLQNAKSDEDFGIIWETFPDLQQNPEFQKEFQYRKRLASKNK